MITYATDEDVALRAPADFLALCPRDQVVAAGPDGLFLASDPWTLRSPAVDFAAAGLAPGQVARLAGQPAAGPQGELFAVAAVGPGGLTLRRIGQGPGVGRPPAPATEVLGVDFAVRTLAPQLARASADLALRFGVDEAIPGRRSSDLRDPRTLAEAAVLAVLAQRYLDLARRFAGTSDEPEDWYGVKARALRAELDDLLDRMVIRWGMSADPGRAAPCGRFRTRLSR